MKNPRYFIVFMLLLFLALPIKAKDLLPVLNWKAYESENFVLFYYEGFEAQAQETLYYLEKYLPRIEKLTGNERNFKIRIVLQDVGLNSSGYAQTWNNKIGLFTNNPTPGSNLSTYQNWLRMVSGHELTHIRQMNNYSGIGAILPTILGDYFAPNMFVPYWVIEGITVYYESSISPYEGRLNDGYFDALVAAKAQANQLPSIIEANYMHPYYPMSQMYLFGSVFFRYLAETYGEDKFAQLFKIQGQRPFGPLGALSPSIGIDSAAKKVYGKTFPELFEEWKDAELHKHHNWKTDGELVTSLNKGYIGNICSYKGKLYYTKIKLLTSSPFLFEGLLDLVEYDPETESERVLKNLSTQLPTKLQICADKIFYLTAQSSQGYANIDHLGFGTTGELKYYHLLSGKTVTIFSDEIKAFTPLDNGDILYAKNKKGTFGAEIWKFANGKKIKLGEVDQSIAEMNQYHDKIIIVSRSQVGSWNINTLNLKNFDIQPLINTSWSETSIFIDGDILFYTGNYDSKYRLYKYNMQTGKVDRLTHSGYAFNGVPLKNQIYFQGLTANGDGLFKKLITPIPFILPEKEIPEEEPINEFAKTLTERSGVGKNVTYLFKPSNKLFPMFLSGEDGLGLTSYDITYSPFLGLDFNLNSRILLPLEFSVSNEIINKEHQRRTVMNLSYPLYRSYKYGVNSLNIGGYTDFIETNIGYINSFLSLPRQNLSINLHGNINNGGLGGDLIYKYNFDNSNLLLQGSVFNKFNKTIMSRTPVPVQTLDSKGITMSLDYTHKLMEVRKGFWDSTLYLSDIYGTLFTDYTNLDNSLTTFGAELSLELCMGWTAHTIPEIGIGINLEGDYRVYIGCQTVTDF